MTATRAINYLNYNNNGKDFYIDPDWSTFFLLETHNADVRKKLLKQIVGGLEVQLEKSPQKAFYVFRVIVAADNKFKAWVGTKNTRAELAFQVYSVDTDAKPIEAFTHAETPGSFGKYDIEFTLMDVMKQVKADVADYQLVHFGDVINTSKIFTTTKIAPSQQLLEQTKKALDEQTSPLLTIDGPLSILKEILEAILKQNKHDVPFEFNSTEYINNYRTDIIQMERLHNTITTSNEANYTEALFALTNLFQHELITGAFALKKLANAFVEKLKTFSDFPEEYVKTVYLQNDIYHADSEDNIRYTHLTEQLDKEYNKLPALRQDIIANFELHDFMQRMTVFLNNLASQSIKAELPGIDGIFEITAENTLILHKDELIAQLKTNLIKHTLPQSLETYIKNNINANETLTTSLQSAAEQLEAKLDELLTFARDELSTYITDQQSLYEILLGENENNKKYLHEHFEENVKINALAANSINLQLGLLDNAIAKMARSLQSLKTIHSTLTNGQNITKETLQTIKDNLLAITEARMSHAQTSNSCTFELNDFKKNKKCYKKLAKIYAQLHFILLENETFWTRRLQEGGGKQVEIDGKKYKTPTKVSYMINALLADGIGGEIPLTSKVEQIITAYKKGVAEEAKLAESMFGSLQLFATSYMRSAKTLAFYAIMDALADAELEMLDNATKLDNVLLKINEFETNYPKYEFVENFNKKQASH